MKGRYVRLDQQLNKAYKERIAAVEKDRVLNLRESQHQWIKDRDSGLALYVADVPAAEKELRTLEYLGDVTSMRLDQFNRPLDEDF